MKEIIHTNKYALYSEKLYGTAEVKNLTTGDETLAITGTEAKILIELIEKAREGYGYALYSADDYVSIIDSILSSQF